MTDSINMNDLDLESKTGRWIVHSAGARTVADKNTFRVKLKASLMKLQNAHKLPCNSERIIKKAQREYDFYFNQIDSDRSDMFALSMYDVNNWTL